MINKLLTQRSQGLILRASGRLAEARRFQALFYEDNGHTTILLAIERRQSARGLTAVTQGIDVMPSYGDLLTEEEIAAVAHYVATSAGRSGK